jgi:hypothetical protein
MMRKKDLLCKESLQLIGKKSFSIKTPEKLFKSLIIKISITQLSQVLLIFEIQRIHNTKLRIKEDLGLNCFFPFREKHFKFIISSIDDIQYVPQVVGSFSTA